MSTFLDRIEDLTIPCYWLLHPNHTLANLEITSSLSKDIKDKIPRIAFGCWRLCILASLVSLLPPYSIHFIIYIVARDVYVGLNNIVVFSPHLKTIPCFVRNALCTVTKAWHNEHRRAQTPSACDFITLFVCHFALSSQQGYDHLGIMSVSFHLIHVLMLYRVIITCYWRNPINDTNSSKSIQVW